MTETAIAYTVGVGREFKMTPHTHTYTDTYIHIKSRRSWSPSSVSCVAARKIVRHSILGPVRDIA